MGERDDRAYKVDFAPDGTVTRWRKTGDGVEAAEDAAYHPSIYVAAPPGPLAELRARLRADPKVLETDLVEKRHDLHAEAPEPALAVTLERIHDVQPLAREVRGVHERGSYAPGTFRCFDVDLSPQFRYCLDRGIDPTPNGDLSTMELAVSDKPLADGEVSALRLGGGRPGPSGSSGPGEPLGDTARETLETLSRELATEDPDVLVVSHSAIVPLLIEAAEDLGLAPPGRGSYGEPVEDAPFHLGRRAGYRTLAGANTVVSYGNVGFSPARYDVPGRALIDTSNSFLWYKTGLDGIMYFVERAGRPVQEVAWGSIGTILTAMQTREARGRDVLVPWNKWEPESFKPVETLHTADKGGLTFQPHVGIHEDVQEVDFASLYPNIMIEMNVSPETVGCERHPTLDTVPEIGYPICAEDGFVPSVLKPMVDYRAKIKGRLDSPEYEDRWERYENEAEAIKWILVSCFGYQGYRNAKFGRIEAHEAINAYARDILLTTKEMVNERGWEVAHGIVDSIWLGAVDPAPAPIEAVVEEVSAAIGIDL
ncbi:MAG TPA: DNA polymerase domain-containing protein, partial [Halobacteriales archaeon]|nr:DNA polymerase domain-containing protein [Halobacteriales archaeon]